MRLLLAALVLAACSADPVLLPDATTPDAGPCGGACGPGTVCSGGACVAVDAGRVDVGEDRPAPVDMGTMDTGGDVPDAADVPADAGVDAGPADALPAGCTSATPRNCCGVACPTPANGAAGCFGSRCGVASCVTGYGDCDGIATNGCETNTTATAAHCGACGATCASGRRCDAGACELVCGEGRADCNGDPADGCEGILTTRDQCGRCGVACGVRQTCVEGVCR